MFLCLVIIINAVLIAAETNSDTGYCDAATKTCPDQEKTFIAQKLLFYDVNPPEGFNLRRDVFMRFAIMLSEARKKSKRLDWQLVLPPWYRLYHWKSENRGNVQPIPWSKFFDTNSLKSYVPVTDLYEIFSKSAGKHLEIDTLYVLQNYEDPFEDGTFVDKWEVKKDGCDYYSDFWGYSNVTAKETICVRFQGRASKLWELVLLHPNDKKVMFAHGEVALHDSYGTKQYWQCRKSMKFSKELIETATKYIRKNFQCDVPKCDAYISIHWRRQDFARSRKNDVPSVKGTVKQIEAAIKNHAQKIKKIFIATDAPMTELTVLENQLKALDYKVYYYLPSEEDLDNFKDGGVAIIDQIICSHAAYFIGTHESTFSFRIQEEREILGFDSKTTFNRFCPDSGACEEPSKWTIVN